MQRLYLLLIAVFLGISANLLGQSIANVRAVQSGDDILIYYDLKDPNSGSYMVQVYCSEDGGINWGSPLQHIEGDANKVVPAGVNRKVLWKVLSERSELVGSQIQFEIRASRSGESTPVNPSAPVTAFSGNVLLDQRDGNSYQVIKVQGTYWMAENLNFNTPGSFCYGNDGKNCDKYGRLYTWDEAKNSCPTGWRLPEESDWTALEKHLGMSENMLTTLRWRGTDQGEKLKKGGPLGFDALYGGFRTDRGSFDRIGIYSYFWSGTEFDDRVAFCRLLLFDNPRIYLNRYNKKQAMSVRCVRN